MMPPEMNGIPPSVTKRKKHLKAATQIDFNMSKCNYFSNHNSSFPNTSIPDMSSYYSFISHPNEPMSLPIYPAYPNYMSTPKFGAPPETNEYMSLPVTHSDQIDEFSKRRFSDPGLPNDSDSSGNELDAKLLNQISQQINALKESNRKMAREMMDIRIEVNLLKQQQSVRHFDRDYEPGMLADIIREVRDAARVREDALLARVKHMIEEKQLSMNHMHLVSDKNRNNDRISKLEEQIRNFSITNTRSMAVEGGDHDDPVSTTSLTARQVIELEREALELRRELQETRAKKEEADQKLMQMDKKLSSLMRRSELLCPTSTLDGPEDTKTTSPDSVSVGPTSTTSTNSATLPPSSLSAPGPSSRITLSGPVTDL